MFYKVKNNLKIITKLSWKITKIFDQSMKKLLFKYITLAYEKN